MTFDGWYFTLGALLIAVAVLASYVKRLPMTETIIYLLAGIIIGPLGLKWASLDAQANSKLLERVSELAVIVSLFTAGLKLRIPLTDKRWWVPVRLATVSMVLTVALVAAVGVYGLGLPLGVAVLLGAVLAPTDPVLASDVQLENAHDRDRLRFSLTGEAGMNDGTAFPFVMLGLGLLGLHELGSGLWRWLTLDVLWAVAGGLGVGAACGAAVAKLVLYLRREHREGVGRDEFLALGLIGLSYGGALLIHAYGFLAVFAAGLCLRAVERTQTGDRPPEEVLEMETGGSKDEIATDPEKAPAHMARAVLSFNEQAERILEVALVLLLALSLSSRFLAWRDITFILLLFVVIRPVAVVAGLFGYHPGKLLERGLISWFGIRGIGSIYYLMYAINRGIEPHHAERLIAITFTAITISILLHGITVTPLMNWYTRLRRNKRAD